MPFVASRGFEDNGKRLFVFERRRIESRLAIGDAPFFPVGSHIFKRTRLHGRYLRRHFRQSRTGRKRGSRSSFLRRRPFAGSSSGHYPRARFDDRSSSSTVRQLTRVSIRCEGKTDLPGRELRQERNGDRTSSPFTLQCRTATECRLHPTHRGRWGLESFLRDNDPSKERRALSNER